MFRNASSYPSGYVQMRVNNHLYHPNNVSCLRQSKERRRYIILGNQKTKTAKAGSVSFPSRPTLSLDDFTTLLIFESLPTMANAENEWELEEGIPQVGDPFIQQYLKGRDALILEEKKRRHGIFITKNQVKKTHI